MNLAIENKKYQTIDREAGNVIDEFDTIEEAENEIERYEHDDKIEGVHEESFYAIKKVQI